MKYMHQQNWIRLRESTHRFDIVFTISDVHKLIKACTDEYRLETLGPLVCRYKLTKYTG